VLDPHRILPYCVSGQQNQLSYLTLWCGLSSENENKREADARTFKRLIFTTPWEEQKMRNGFRIVDIDTHVNPSYETLVKYLDPNARSRVAELQPFVRTRNLDGTTTQVLHVAPYPFDRFPGEAPAEAKVMRAERARSKAVSPAHPAITACLRRAVSRMRTFMAASRTWMPRVATSIS